MKIRELEEESHNRDVEHVADCLYEILTLTQLSLRGLVWFWVRPFTLGFEIDVDMAFDLELF